MQASDIFSGKVKVGVLGGGQLGKMLAQAAADWHLPFYAMDSSADSPAAPYCTGFSLGDFRRAEDVIRFGRTVDVLSIEIEHVNTDALRQLVAEGVIVHPAPDAIDLIKDKGLQKQFYERHGLPTAPFQLFDGPEAVQAAIARQELAYPFVQKSRKGGYDGRGVSLIRGAQDELLPGPCLVETAVAIEKELAVIVARNADGAETAFPVVEMEFNSRANLVEFLLCPARISEEVAAEARRIALAAARAFGVSGLLAVELFQSRSGEILINEVAPRPHNSGHHTIEACLTSQYQQHLRAILNLPLGDTSLRQPAVMLNLLGEAGHSGEVVYDNISSLLAEPGAYAHLYGKTHTKPFRKMGHITLLGATVEEVVARAAAVKGLVKVKTAD